MLSRHTGLNVNELGKNAAHSTSEDLSEDQNSKIENWNINHPSTTDFERDQFNEVVKLFAEGKGVSVQLIPAI